MTPDRPRAEFRHPWRLLALAIIGWAMLFAWAFVQDADADDHGIVVTCTTVQVWDHNRLGDVLVEYADGTDAEGRFGNAATFANDGPHGRVVRIVTDHHTYTVPAPSGCVPATTSVVPTTTTSGTSTVATTTTTAPFGETQPSVPPTITPPPPPEGPPASTPTVQTGDPSVASTTVPPARPATPTVASPSFTG